MAKDKTATAPVAVKDGEEDDVMKEIRSQNISEVDLAAEVQADIDKENKEKQKSALKSAILHAKYETLLARLDLRKRRREADITKKSLAEKAELLSKLAGKTKDGKTVEIKDRITIVEYRDLKSKMDDESRKKMNESESIYRKEVEELNNTDCGNYRHYWYD